MKKALGLIALGGLGLYLGKVYMDHEYVINKAMKKMTRDNEATFRWLKSHMD